MKNQNMTGLILCGTQAAEGTCGWLGSATTEREDQALLGKVNGGKYFQG